MDDGLLRLVPFYAVLPIVFGATKFVHAAQVARFSQFTQDADSDRPSARAPGGISDRTAVPISLLLASHGVLYGASVQQVD